MRKIFEIKDLFDEIRCPHFNELRIRCLVYIFFEGQNPVVSKESHQERKKNANSVELLKHNNNRNRIARC